MFFQSEIWSIYTVQAWAASRLPACQYQGEIEAIMKICEKKRS